MGKTSNQPCEGLRCGETHAKSCLYSAKRKEAKKLSNIISAAATGCIVWREAPELLISVSRNGWRSHKRRVGYNGPRILLGAEMEGTGPCIDEK